MTDLKVGDRVKIFDVCQVTNLLSEDSGTILKLNEDGGCVIKCDTWSSPCVFHPRQLRRLKRKEYPVPERVWINNYSNPNHIAASTSEEGADGWDKIASGIRIGGRAWPYVLDRKSLRGEK